MTTIDLGPLKVRRAAARVALVDAASVLQALAEEAYRVHDEAYVAGDVDVQRHVDEVARVAQSMVDKCQQIADYLKMGPR